MKQRKPRTLRFYLVTSIVLLLTVAIVTGVSMHANFRRLYREKLLVINQHTVNGIVQTIERNYTDMARLMDSFATNITVQQFLGETDNYRRTVLHGTLGNLILSYKTLNSNVNSIILRSAAGGIYTDTSTPRLNINTAVELFAHFEESSLPQTARVGDEDYLVFYRAIYDPAGVGAQVGDCLLVLNLRFLTGYMNSATYDDTAYYITDEEMALVATNLPAGHSLGEGYLAYLAGGGATATTVDRQNLAVSSRVPGTPWTVLCVTPLAVVYGDLGPVLRFTLVALLVCGALFFLIYRVFIQRLPRSVEAFGAHMRRIENGEMGIEVSIDSNSDFASLSQGFNRMMARIDDLNAQNLAFERRELNGRLENKRSQLLALQSQVNPHFLYNTLECINSMGSLYGSEEIQQMSTSLAYIFRYSITGSNLVSVRDELETVRHYIGIQKMRFPERFTIEYRLGEGLLEVKLLKFLLQPLVENSIIHGVENAAHPCALRISVQSDGGVLHISVADDGPGIPPLRLREIQDGLAQCLEDTPRARTSIGLVNIHKRIALYYGPGYGLDIQSEAGRGTVVSLALPTQT